MTNKAVRRGPANLQGSSAVGITTAFLFVGNVMGTMTVEIALMKKTVCHGSAQRANFDAVTRAAFRLDGSVTTTMTVEITPMNGTVR